jgi:hypothetical protein
VERPVVRLSSCVHSAGVKASALACVKHRQSGMPARPGALSAPARTARTDSGLVEVVRKLLAASACHGEGHRKVCARLRVAGLRTSIFVTVDHC